jgi:hypothetical protein
LKGWLIGEPVALWRSVLAEGLAGTVTALIAVVGYDRVKSTHERRERAAADRPIFSAALLAADAAIQAWIPDHGVPPDADPSETAADVESAPNEARLEVTSSRLAMAKSEVGAAAELAQTIRQAAMRLQPAGQGTVALQAIQTDAVAVDEALRSYLGPGSVLHPVRRAARVASADALVVALSDAQSVRDSREFLAAASLVAQSASELRIVDAMAKEVEHGTGFGRVVQSPTERVTLEQTRARVRSAVQALLDADEHTDLAECSRLVSEVADAASDMPQLMGLHVNAARTAGLFLSRIDDLLHQVKVAEARI